MACPFCEIDEERQRVLWRDTDVYIMPSNPMLVPHHLLVIPTRHVEKPWDMEPRVSKKLFDAVIELQRRIVGAGYSPWCDVRQHYRPSLPESEEKVNHLHWHILPRRLHDTLYQQSQICVWSRFYFTSTISMPYALRMSSASSKEYPFA